MNARLAETHWSKQLITQLQTNPKRSAQALAASLCGSLSESLGLVSMLPLLQTMIGGSYNTSPVHRIILTILESLHLRPTVGVLLFTIVFLIALRGVLSFISLVTINDMIMNHVTELRLKLFRATVRAQWLFFLDQTLDLLTNTIAHKTQNAGKGYRSAVEAVSGLFQVVVLVTMSFFIKPEAVILSVVAALALSVVLTYFLRMGSRANRKYNHHFDRFTNALNEIMQGMKSIKAMNLQEFIHPMVEREVADINITSRFSNLAAYGLVLVREPIIALVLVCGMYVLIEYVNVDLPDLLTITLLFYRTSTTVGQIQSHLQTLSHAGLFNDEVDSFLLEAQAATETCNYDQSHSIEFKESIVFDHINFSYRSLRVLHDISFRIEYGSFVALSGPSGSGKTTIVELLCGLYRADSGNICIDGKALDEKDIPSWRKGIGYAPQDQFLFHDTIYRNVNLGDPNISGDDVIQALKTVDAWKFVSLLENGMYSVIGERGLRLSGGQRQKIILARAVARKPRLLILDESTASIDSESEQEIVRALKQLKQNMTIIAISHQPAICDAADRKITIRDGRVESDRV